MAPAEAEAEAEVFRLYDGRLHIFTASEAERESLEGTGWNYEGVTFRAGE